MSREPGFIKRAPRTDLRRTAVLTDSEGISRDVIIVDMSDAGFKLSVGQTPRIGEHVRLSVNGAAIDAQIRWALGDQAGGVFLQSDDSGKVA